MTTTRKNPNFGRLVRWRGEDAAWLARAVGACEAVGCWDFRKDGNPIITPDDKDMDRAVRALCAKHPTLPERVADLVEEVLGGMYDGDPHGRWLLDFAGTAEDVALVLGMEHG